MTPANMFADDYSFIPQDYKSREECEDDESVPFFDGQSNAKFQAINDFNHVLRRVSHASSISHESVTFLQHNTSSLYSQIVPVTSFGLLLLSLIFGVLFITNELYIYLIPVFFSVIVFSIVLSVSVYLRKRVKHAWKMKKIKT